MGRVFRVVGVVVQPTPPWSGWWLRFGLFVVAEYAVWIGMLVYAFHHGGATASGLVAMAQLLPGILIAPLLAAVADRRSPTLLLTAGYVAQAVAMQLGVAISLFAYIERPAARGLRPSCCGQYRHGRATRPAQSAVLPSTARVAQELTAANVIAGWAENFGIVVSAAMAADLPEDRPARLAVRPVSAALVGAAAVLVVPVRVTGIDLADENDDQQLG